MALRGGAVRTIYTLFEFAFFDLRQNFAAFALRTLLIRVKIGVQGDALHQVSHGAQESHVTHVGGCLLEGEAVALKQQLKSVAGSCARNGVELEKFE